MNRSISTSLQLCTRCFNFLRPFGASCTTCLSLRLDVSNGSNYVNYPRFQSRLALFSTRTNNLVDTQFRSSSVSVLRSSRSLLSQLAVGKSSPAVMPFDQKILVRSLTNPAMKPPNPLPPRKKSRDDSQKSPISWRNLFIVAGIGGALLVGMGYVKKEKEQEREKARNLKMGKAKLGGDWTLIDHHGNQRSSRDFRGQWLLIYFGFTNCPDICPEELEKIVSVINKTDNDGDLPKLQPILITVDPERDTPEALKEYCAEFSPRILGFSGSQEQVHTATRAYRVYYSQGPKDEDNDYIVDHSIISYLVNPNGDFVDYFGQNKKDEEIYKSIKLHILSYQRQEKKGN